MANCRSLAALGMTSLLVAGAFFPAAAQVRPGSQLPRLPELRFERELVVDMGRTQMTRYSQVLVDRHGRMYVATGAWDGELLGFDSTGKSLGWRVPIGRRGGKDIGWINKWGFNGDSVWIADNMFNQIVVLGDSGRVERSAERPTWLRPAWGDRRRFPLFSGMDWEASYPDGSVLVIPGRPRALFDTPLYDRSAIHLLRATPDGKILRLVAKLPAAAGMNGHRLQLRDGTERRALDIPYHAKTAWKVSADGQRIVIVQPLLTAADSGAFRVVMLNADGDTVFARRYASAANRVPQDAIELRLAAVRAFGRHSAEWIRDTLRTLIPVFESRVMNVQIGMDNSTWVWIRSMEPGSLALVLDPAGEPMGWAKFAPGTRIVALTKDRVWTVERDPASRVRDAGILVRSRATASRSARSVSASASRSR